VYASTTPSLAMLEFLAHVGEEDAPRAIYLVEIILPQMPEVLKERMLPKNWKAIPPPRATQVLGSKWVRSCKSLALSVPSVLLPTPVDRNVVINVAHPKMFRVKVAGEARVNFDRRLAR
jgi:RES domain-containing protein